MDNIGVRITADPSGVGPGVATTKTELGSLESFAQTLNASFQSLGARIREAFTGGAGAAKEMGGAIKTTEAATVSETAALGAMIAKVHEGAESVRTFQMRAKEFAEVYVAMFAVEQISEFISKMGEAAERVQHLSQQFGMSVREVQQLDGVAKATGISADSLTRAMGFMDRNLANAAMGSRNLRQAFDAVGISLNDGRSQMEKLEVVADKFKNMEDGPKKAALAMQLFGRSGRELIPVLNLGSDGIAQLNKKMEEYGVVNDDAVAKGLVLAENVNETKLGFAGMENVLTDALAPALTELVGGVNELIAAFVQSYEQGGIVAVIFTAISDVIQVVVAVVEALGSIFKAIWSVIVEVVSDIWHVVADAFGIQVPKNVNVAKLVLIELKNVIEIIKDAIILFVDSAGAAFEALGKVVMTFGTIAYDALHLDWGSIQSDWAVGMNGVVNIVHQAAGKIEADARAMAGAIAAAAAGQAAPGTESPSGIKLPKGGGDGSFDYNPTGSPKKEKQKKEKDELVQHLEEELEARKTAWAMEQDAQGTAQAYSLQSEADYWAQALSRTDLSAKDRLAVERKFLAARSALLADQISQQMDVYKEELNLAGQNWAKKRAILEQEVTYTARMYGPESRKAKEAAEAVVEAKRQEADQLRQINEQIAESDDGRRLAQTESSEKAAEFEVAVGRLTEGQLLRMKAQFEQQRYEIERAALQRRLQLMLLDPGMNPVAYQQLKTKIEELERQHQAKMTEIERSAEMQRSRVRLQFAQQLSQTWAQTLGQMATLQMSFTKGVASLWQGLQQAIGNAIASILQDWLQRQIEALIIGKTQKLGEATGEIGANAAVAASGAYAATAAIPIVGPELAPAAAATAYAGAMSWMAGLSALSAEKGDWNVKEGLYHLHEKEMVLPSWAAEALRTTLGSGGGDTGGDSHLHLHGQLITGPREIKRWFENNRHGVGAGVREFVRQGGSAAGRR